MFISCKFIFKYIDNSTFDEDNNNTVESLKLFLYEIINISDTWNYIDMLYERNE